MNVLALSTLLFQYAFRKNHQNSKATISDIFRELSVFQYDSLDDDDCTPLIGYQTVADFLYRKTVRPHRSTVKLIEEFLVDKGFLDRLWYNALEASEQRVQTYLSSFQPYTESFPDVQGMYIYEGHAFTESLIAYCLVSQASKHIATVQLGERVYRRGLEREERGSEFQSRLDEGASDHSQRYIGYLRVSENTFEVHFLNNEEYSSVPSIERFGDVLIEEENETRIITLNLLEDGINRIYVNHTQPIGKKGKYTPNLTNRYKNNIMYAGRFFDARNVRSKMEPVYFEERNCDFSDLDFKLLEAAAEGNAVEMVRCLIKGANINVCDPETGKTALHLTTKALSVPGACVLVPREYAGGRQQLHDTVLTDLYHVCENEGMGSIEDIDFKLRAAQQKLNPLNLDKNYNFASTESRFSEFMSAVLHREIDDPLFDTRHDLEMIVGNSIVGRLSQCGIVPVIAGIPLESRLAHINEYRAHKAENEFGAAPPAFK